jgi:uncharacterized coiled-coil DUF342 family protein
MRRTTNALAVEPEEALVSSDEPLEANVVVSIRTDLKDLKAEFRAVVARIDHDIRSMAAKAESEIKTAVARIDEQFREVRQDIRGLTATNETLRDRINESHSSLDKKIDATRESLDRKIDIKVGELRDDMKEMRADIKDIRGELKEIRGEIKEVRGEMKEGFAGMAETRADIADLKAMQKAMLWVLGSIVALSTIAGAGLAIARAVHWI